MSPCVCSGSATEISISRRKSETNFGIPSPRRWEPSPASPARRVTAGPRRARRSSPVPGAGHSTPSITGAEAAPRDAARGLPPAGATRRRAKIPGERQGKAEGRRRAGGEAVRAGGAAAERGGHR